MAQVLTAIRYGRGPRRSDRFQTALSALLAARQPHKLDPDAQAEVTAKVAAIIAEAEAKIAELGKLSKRI